MVGVTGGEGAGQGCLEQRASDYTEGLYQSCLQAERQKHVHTPRYQSRCVPFFDQWHAPDRPLHMPMLECTACMCLLKAFLHHSGLDAIPLRTLLSPSGPPALPTGCAWLSCVR